ncbi:TIGR04255 family protein [Arcobacter sp. s6]|uniref:TIGR04255 family protein n=1 Tax=Arcobacter sp. s6 TaxID=3230363 RepID=UPI0034A01006
MEKPFPKSITPTPIISASIEIRFDVNCPLDAVFGIVFNALRTEYNEHEPLPISTIPEQIRIQDGLIDQPHYRLFKKNSSLSILLGPKLFVFLYAKEDLNSSEDYPGWTDSLSIELKKLYSILFSLNIISKVTRLGIRCNDFFEDRNIFNHTEYNILDSEHNRKDLEKTQIIQTIEKNGFVHNVVVSNNSNFIANGIITSGSMIDIDSFTTDIKDDFSKNYEKYLNNCHETNKEFFYKMLKKDFIDSLNPIY